MGDRQRQERARARVGLLTSIATRMSATRGGVVRCRRMVRVGPIVVGAVLVVLAGAAAAGGATVEAVAPVPPLQGPVIAGDRLAFVPLARPGATSQAIDAASGRRVRRVAVLHALAAPPDGAPFFDRALAIRIAASPSAIAATATTIFGSGEGLAGGRPTQYVEQTWAGPPAGPLVPVSAPCAQPGTVFAARLLLPGADGSRIAAVGATCGPKTVLDLSTRTRQVLPEAAGYSVIPGPGGRVAWAQAPDTTDPPDVFATVVVADASGAELARLPVTSGPLLTLDAGGTLATFGALDPSQLNARVVKLLAPGATSPQTVRAPAGTQLRGARVAGGQLALLIAPTGGDTLTRGEVVITALDGTQPRTVLRGVNAFDQDHFDFDGHDVAAVVSDCDRVLLIRHPITDRPAGPLGRTHCPLRLARRARWSPTGLRIAISCRDATPCSVQSATARLRGPTGPALGHATQQNSTFTIRIRDKRLRRNLTARTRTRIWLKARLTDGPTRTTTITVMRRKR